MGFASVPFIIEYDALSFDFHQTVSSYDKVYRSHHTWQEHLLSLMLVVGKVAMKVATFYQSLSLPVSRGSGVIRWETPPSSLFRLLLSHCTSERLGLVPQCHPPQITGSLCML